MTCYDESGSIGKRYRRSDAIGTPYCITIDEDTINNGTVTGKFRFTFDKKDVEQLRELFRKEDLYDP